MKRLKYKITVYRWAYKVFEKEYEFTSEEEATGFKLGFDQAFREFTHITNVHLEKL